MVWFSPGGAKETPTSSPTEPFLCVSDGFYHKRKPPKYIDWQFSRSILIRKKQNANCNVRKFRRFLFDLSPVVPVFKV